MTDMKKLLAIICSLVVCVASHAQNADDGGLIPGSWVREKGEIVQVGVSEDDSRCLTYEELQQGLSADEFIALRKAFQTYDVGIHLLGDGIGYALAYGLTDLLYCKVGGYEFDRLNWIMYGLGAASAISGLIIIPIANKKIDRVVDSHNTSIGLGPDRGTTHTITILPTVVTFNGNAAPAAGSAAAKGLNVAPGLGISVRF